MLRWTAGCSYLLGLAMLCVGLCLGSGCTRNPTLSPHPGFVVKERVAGVPIRWLDLPRPSPLPPLEYGALLVPVSFPGYTGKQLYMQFDLGHPHTVFYANKWADLSPRLQQGGDLPNGSKPRISRLTFSLGGLTVTAADLAVLPNQGAGIRWDEDTIEVVGTIGSDLIAGRTVVMDFKANRIQVAENRTLVTRPGEVFTPFKYRWRRILIPALVDGKPGQILYDSGSSAFAFITDATTWSRLSRPGAAPMQFPVKSWKRTLTAHVVATDSVLQIGPVTLPIQQVSHIEGMGWLQKMGMRFFGLGGEGGMVGNRLFLGRRLILDTARQEVCLSD